MIMKIRAYVFLLLFIIPFILPLKVNALANPAATSCVDSGGDYQIITNPDGSQSGKCVYIGGFECSSYEFFKGSGCLPQQLLFGNSLIWWIIRLSLLCLVSIIFYRIYKRLNNPKYIKVQTSPQWFRKMKLKTFG